MPETERFLVVLPNWFGEVLFTTPFLSNLRASFPNSFIAAMGVPRSHEALSGNPSINEFVLYDEEGIHRKADSRVTLIKQLRSFHFSTAFILRRSLSRTWLAARAGIKRRIGFSNLKSGWLLTHRVRMMDGVHKAWTYLDLLKPLGFEAKRLPYSFYPGILEREQAIELLKQNGIYGDASFAIVHPGANWDHKRWPAEKFAEVAEMLKLPVVLTGSPSDAGLINQVTSRMKRKPVVLAGKTTVRILAACIERSKLFISNDTGIMHIACALNKPVVALFGPTSPDFTGPIGNPSRTVVIHHPGCCPRIPCYDPNHPGFLGMEAITVEEVIAASEKILIGK